MKWRDQRRGATPRADLTRRTARAVIEFGRWAIGYQHASTRGDPPRGPNGDEPRPGGGRGSSGSGSGGVEPDHLSGRGGCNRRVLHFAGVVGRGTRLCTNKHA